MTEPAGRPPSPAPTQPGAARPPGATPLQIAQNAPDAGRLRIGGDQLLRLGTVVADRYEVNALLGRGGFGEVYRARHTGTHEMVALKVLRPELLAESAAVDRFTAEARLCASLRHPNTVRVFDFGQTPEKALYLAMEFLAGESLEEILARGPLPPKRAVHIVNQVLRSLSEAHGRKIVHRDLKPDNVFVGSVAGEADFVHVIDFGIAKFLAEGANAALTQAGAIIGTPHYMSPEQIRGETLDARADLYSVGVLLFRCLSGRHPYDGDTTFAILAAHLGDALPSLQPYHIDRGLEAIVVRALSRDRQARYATADLFRAALEHWQASAGPDVDAASTQISMDVLKPHAVGKLAEPLLPPGAQTVVTSPGADPELQQTTIGPPPEMTAVDAVPRPPVAPTSPPPPPGKSAGPGKHAPPAKGSHPPKAPPPTKPADAQALTTAEPMPQPPALLAAGRAPETAVISTPSTQVLAMATGPEKKPGVASDSQRPRTGTAPPARRSGPEPVRLNSDSGRARAAAAARSEAADNATVAMNILAPQLETAVVSLEDVQRHAEKSGELRQTKGKSAWPLALGALLVLLLAGGAAWWFLFASGDSAAPTAQSQPASSALPPQPAPAPALAAPTAAPAVVVAPVAAAPTAPAVEIAAPASVDSATADSAKGNLGVAPAPVAPERAPPVAVAAEAKPAAENDAAAEKPGQAARHPGKSSDPSTEKSHKSAKSCPAAPGSKEWCTTCPAARDLSSSSPHYCACLQHKGETSGLAYYCKCVFTKEYHKVGSTPYCKCNPRDPACHE